MYEIVDMVRTFEHRSFPPSYDENGNEQEDNIAVYHFAAFSPSASTVLRNMSIVIPYPTVIAVVFGSHCHVRRKQTVLNFKLVESCECENWKCRKIWAMAYITVASQSQYMKPKLLLCHKLYGWLCEMSIRWIYMHVLYDIFIEWKWTNTLCFSPFSSVIACIWYREWVLLYALRTSGWRWTKS